MKHILFILIGIIVLLLLIFLVLLFGLLISSIDSLLPVILPLGIFLSFSWCIGREIYHTFFN